MTDHDGTTVNDRDDLLNASSDDYAEEDTESQRPSVQKQKQKQKTKAKTKETEVDADEKPKKKILIRKYTANGTLPLHESAIIANQPTFVSLANANGRKPQLFKYIQGTGDKDFYPPDTIDTHNPIPYSYDSIEDFKYYIELAKLETFDSLYTMVRNYFDKYVNVEDYYAKILVADVIYSYFQDKFSETHYNIFVGDNGSGKNSALLFFRHVGYRVFYGLAMSAPNYYTFLGDIEECQGCIAEDEAEDMAYDKDKQKILKGGYCSGATVPKVDLSFGRKQDVWLTYSHKWFAMEELPDYKYVKGILDRSFVYHFVVGKVDYNIKDVIRHGGDQQYKQLKAELDHIRKLLFAFRLVRYDDIIPQIKLNVIHRNEELTKPLLRLFSYRNDSPHAFEKIRLALSRFLIGRNEAKKNSLESKLFETAKSLLDAEIKEHPVDTGESQKEFYEFSNELIHSELTNIIGWSEIPEKSAYYSPETGKVTHSKITRLYKSKLKAESCFMWDSHDEKSKRGLKFSQKMLGRLELYYNVPDEIKILTLLTEISCLEGGQGQKNNILEDLEDKSHAQYASDTTQKTDEKKALLSPNDQKSVRSVRKFDLDLEQNLWHCNHCSFCSGSRWDFKMHLQDVHYIQWEDQSVPSKPNGEGTKHC